MQFTVNIECPECGENDVSTLEIDEATPSYFTLECEHCTNPYVVGITTTIKAQAYRIIKAE
jgi:uncharacterized Zn finger protein